MSLYVRLLCVASHSLCTAILLIEFVYGRIASMNTLIHTLCLLRPVYWILPEAKNSNGFPHETLQNPDVEALKSAGCGVFFCPNEMGDNPNHKGNLRHDQNISRFTSVFVDIDKGSCEEQLNNLKEYPIPPSVIVKTGRGHHAYWILDRFTPIDRDRWQRVQKQLAHDLRGDAACTDPARLMRLPGSFHVKNEPKLVSIIHHNEHWIYSLDDFPEIKTFTLSSPTKSDPRKKRILKPPREPTLTTLHEGERHGALVKETARYFHGIAPSEVQDRTASILAWYAQACRPLKKNWQQEVMDVIEWVLHKELGNLSL